jgi:uncharacterized protein (TIGR02246 family)
MDVETEVAAVFRAFESAWNAHDTRALAALWTESGNLLHPWGRFATGHTAIEELLREEHESRMSGSSNRIVSLSTRKIAGDAIVAEGEGVIENVTAPNGTSYTLDHQFSAVLVREAEQWRFMSFQPTLKPARTRA